MVQYDLNVILNPALDPQQLQIEKDYIENTVRSANGTISTVDEWGNRRMAYPIAKDREGYYLIYRVSLPNEATNSIQASLRLRDHIRRVLVVKQRPEWRTKKA